jgi:hypothetical protein
MRFCGSLYLWMWQIFRATRLRAVTLYLEACPISRHSGNDCNSEAAGSGYRPDYLVLWLKLLVTFLSSHRQVSRVHWNRSRQVPQTPLSINIHSNFLCVRFEVFTAVTIKNAVFWDVAPCRSCVNRCFGGTYSLRLQGRNIRERGTSVCRWLLRSCTLGSLAPRLLDQCSPGIPASFPSRHVSMPALACYLMAHLHRPLPWPLYWFFMWPTLPPFLVLHSWAFSTSGSFCNHLLTLVHSSRIFLPWRWRRYIPPKRQFTRDLHGATPQKTAFF